MDQAGSPITTNVVRLVRNISPRDRPDLQFLTTKTFANFYISEIIPVAQMIMSKHKMYISLVFISQCMPDKIVLKRSPNKTVVIFNQLCTNYAFVSLLSLPF